MLNKDSLTLGQKKTQELSERRAAMFAAAEVLKAKKKFIILTACLAMFGTFCGHFMQEPTYETGSSLFVQALVDPTAAEYLLHQQVGRSNKADRIETYIRYLSSDQFYLSAAQRLKFHPEFKKINFIDPSTKSAFKTAFWKEKLKDFLVSEKARRKKVLRPQSIEEVSAFIRGTTRYETDYSHFIHIKTKALDPATAQLIANTVAEEFVAITNQRGISEITQIKKFVGDKITATENKLKEIELELIEFKKTNNIISTEASSNQLSERYTNISQQLETAQISFEENQKLIQFFIKGQKTNLENSTNSGKSGSFNAKDTVYLLQKKLEQLKKEKSLTIAQEDQNQKYRLTQLNTEIEKTASVLRKYVRNIKSGNMFLYMNPKKIQLKIQQLKEENAVLSRSIASYKKVISRLDTKIKDIPYLAQKQFMLENTLRLETENYANLKNKLSELEIQKISHKKEVRVDQLASLPGATPKGSLILKLIFSLLAATFFGVSIILGIETVDPTVKHRSDLKDCGLEFIGDIPLVEETRTSSRSNKTFGTSPELICLHQPDSIETMAFKYIRARIESARYKQKKTNQIISVSSGLADEGKSFIAANLAVCLSQLKRSVLLIDCDLRRPFQHVYFEINPKYGLVDLIEMKKPLHEVAINDITPYLDFVPAGYSKDSSTEYVSSEKFKAFLNYVSKNYDYIIIDTPPTFAAVDASIIASYSDIPILVSNFRTTKKSELVDAYNQMLQVSYKKVYGIINKAILSTSRFHYYGYHSTPVIDNSSPTASREESAEEIQDFLKSLDKKSG